MPQPMRILLVEDHADSARALAMMLRMDGHTVRVASTAAVWKRAKAHVRHPTHVPPKRISPAGRYQPAGPHGERFAGTVSPHSTRHVP
jgi:CheY-like chemotaxis protein